MPGNDLRLLALDGGGVRGLSALMILERLMDAVNPDAPPKPCEYFDMIGGTSTGGLIAIMLGRLRMSIDECIKTYLVLSDRVFKKIRHRWTLKGRIQGRFDSEKLAQAVKAVVTEQGLDEDALLKDSPEAGCKVFVCATSKETSETVCLTSYRSPRGNGDLLDSVTIWEACRATSAASSFFDPIAIGRYKEKFIDGATGANNPVQEVWDQAQLVWGPELESKVQCFVSIGTGMPSLKPFKDDILYIGKTLVAIATETEQTAQRFQREKSLLKRTGRYYRFNVAHGLENIGLEEAKKKEEIAAATRRYISIDEVFMQIQACANNISAREYFGEYRIHFSLEGVPKVARFVDRPDEMAKLERVLLPRRGHSQGQRIHILHGMGGIGKTQLAVEFAQRHHRRFSSVFWLDGQSETSLKRSIASYASKIPQGQISGTTQAYAASDSADIDAVVRDVLRWLAQPDNASWLLIFDNVDRKFSERGGDPDSYDVKRFFAGAVHGAILITTRLARLEQLGDSQPLGRVSREQARAILKSRCDRTDDMTKSDRLFELLDGLPLAIAQAGAYLQETRVPLTKYLDLYETQWNELMESGSIDDDLLHDYPDRSVCKTWAISFQAIKDTDRDTANLLILWSFFHTKDLWYGLFRAACDVSEDTADMLSEWIGGIASSEAKFIKAMQLLRNYSLVENIASTSSYATHPVVHQWAYHFQGRHFESRLGQLAVLIVGWSVPGETAKDVQVLHRRLLPHAQACSAWVAKNPIKRVIAGRGGNRAELRRDKALLEAVHNLGVIYRDLDRLADAERMYKWTLQGMEEALGTNHESTLTTWINLGTLFRMQGNLDKAEQVYKQMLPEIVKALGPDHRLRLEYAQGLAVIYWLQNKLDEAEQICTWALQRSAEVLESNDLKILDTVVTLGNIYADQDQLDEAKRLYEWALQRTEEVLGPNHPKTLQTISNLGIILECQGKLADAERMYQRALEGWEVVLGPNHTSTLQSVHNLGNIFVRHGKLTDAERLYKRALQGYERLLGENELQQYLPALNSTETLGYTYTQQGQYTKARTFYSRALLGLQGCLGQSSDRCRDLASRIASLPTLDTNEAEDV